MLVKIVLVISLCYGLAFSLTRCFIQKNWGKTSGADLLCAFYGLGMLVLYLGFLCFISPPYACINWVREWFYFPISTSICWSLVVINIYIGLMIFGLVVSYGWAWRRRKLKTVDTSNPLKPENLSRRQFLGFAVLNAAPAVAMGMGVHGTRHQFDLRLREFAVPVQGLPPELEGFTITHLSDLHSGLFCGKKRLGIIHDLAHELHSDLILVTGDIIDSAEEDVPDVMDILVKLKAPYGLFVSQGNHDIIPGDWVLGKACQKYGLPFLCCSRRKLSVRGAILDITGFPWVDPHNFDPREMMAGMYHHPREEKEIRLLMAHHPHLLDVAWPYADIVLSGHTHGGQLMVGDYGIGSLCFRYWSGYYRREKTSLLVSNGCAEWFPCRIGAPAEILKLTLVPMA